MPKEIVLTKTERQLILFDIISNCEVTEFIEITSLLPIDKRMIQRDIADLTAAGLLSITFSKKERGYVHCGTPEFDETATGKRKEYLAQLNRLGTLMKELCDDGQSFWQDDWEPYYDYDEDGKAFLLDIPPDYFTAFDCYYQLFPDSNEQDRQQDFEILNRIGYEIRCTPTGDYYTVCPFGDHELWDDYGVRRREDGKLVMKVS